ncbi:two component transcriptional regulator, LuxR family [Sinomicrobium oceani]|uniref:Two component transcriptional regulator, LuxR family n=1 Tax=Sinomicrobium oceani TaxID=1150368 RepID=A0A1K1LNL9_9FLAO|nr:response regulator transcription factor [Sinomicrobium oceani]SFW12489.1 two component transcriptional regulator, LuxR family [Sinomicrobium oceani]
MIKVYITDDHPIVQEGIKNLLATRDEISLTGVYQNGKDTLEALVKEEPDVLLLDINLPDISGIELSKQIRDAYPELKIIVLSVHNEKAVISSVLQNGVNGYVLKNSIGDEIIQAIHKVIDGELYMCVQTRDIYNNQDTTGPDFIPKITRREKEILQLVTEGMTSAQIAEKLFISPYTVETHRKNLMEKFDVNNMTAIIKYATEFKLL